MTELKLHKGQEALLLTAHERFLDGRHFTFPDNGDWRTLRYMADAGFLRFSEDIVGGVTLVKLTDKGCNKAEQILAEKLRKEAGNKARRQAKEIALHRIGHAIQFLTELDTPSDQMLDKSIERLGGALKELGNARGLKDETT